MLQLAVERGQSVGHSWTLTDQTTSLGRSADNDIVIPGDKISRVHCTIERVGQNYVLTDRSTNGILVNGRPVDRQVTLQPDDRLQLGEFVLHCRFLPDVEPAIPVEPTFPVGGASVEPASMPIAASQPSPMGQGVSPAPPRRRMSNLIPIAVGTIGAIVILVAVTGATVFLSRQDAAAPGSTPAAPTMSPVQSPVAAGVTTPAPGTPTSPSAVPTIATPDATAQLPAGQVAIEGRVKAPDGLNVRGGTGATFALLYALSDGGSVTVNGRNESGDWYRIVCAAGQPTAQPCWVAAQYIEILSGATVPVVK